MVESRADESCHDDSADEGPRDGVVRDEQPRHRSGERQLACTVDGEGHGAGDHERADQAATDGDQEGRFQRMLRERELEVEADAHGVSARGRGARGHRVQSASRLRR